MDHPRGQTSEQHALEIYPTEARPRFFD